jgi:hypothetical protein
MKGTGVLDLAGWAVWGLLTLLAFGGAATHPGGLALGLPRLPVALAIVAATVLLARFSRAEAARVLLGLAPILFVLFLLAPRFSWLRALSGPPLLALAAAGVLVAFPAATLVPLRRVFFPCVLVLYLVVAARVQSQVGPQGDEPHYLVVAESLLRDRDVAVEKDFAEGRYRAFHPETLAPHYRVRGRDGVIYSMHAVGLSVLVLPALAAGGYAGASFFLALLAALLARELRALLAGVLEDEALADAAAWLAALSPPLIHYAGLIFTEVPAALLAAVVLRRHKAVGGSGMGPALAAGLALAALPWLNVRYALLAGILWALCLVARPPWRNTLALTLPAVLSAGAIAAYHFVLYGFFDPGRVYGRHPEFSVGLLPEGLPGLFLDQEFGLLVYAPALVLAIPGVVVLFRRSPRLAVAACALAASVILVAAAWPMWRGGFNPPGRFLVPLLPVLVLCCAAAVARARSAALVLLLGFGLWTGLTGAAQPRWVHRDRDGTAPLFRVQSGAEEWTRLLPGFVLTESAPDRARLAAVWTAVLASAAIAATRRRDATPKGFALACLALLGAAALASRLSTAMPTGRDAVRVVGRPALELPSGPWTAAQEARWDASRLSWGGLYEPHRHPDGAALGERLPLPPGEYDLDLETRAGWPGGAIPTVEVRSHEVRLASLVLEPGPGGLRGGLTVPAGVDEISLFLRGGGPLALDRVVLRVQPSGRPPGPSH